MESAYLYVRVSTDEQKRKGFSLVEQEERLLKHCEINNIKVKEIFREDYSAKDFNRPKWKKLINIIKRNRKLAPENILFLKWDRFSRSIEYAYQMMGILRNLSIKTMAIDQPIDFDVPESIVMLAVYLSIPEAENNRRGLNTSDGMRRAKKMGRWSGKAPIGYANFTDLDGKKFIAPKQPAADHIKWSFHLSAKGIFTINQVWKMACTNGFECGKSNFWKLIRNPPIHARVSALTCRGGRLVSRIYTPLIYPRSPQFERGHLPVLLKNQHAKNIRLPPAQPKKPTARKVLNNNLFNSTPIFVSFHSNPAKLAITASLQILLFFLSAKHIIFE